MPRKKYATLEDRLIANSRINETESYGGTRCWDWVGAFGTGGRGDPYPQMSLRVNGKHTVKRAHLEKVPAARIWPGGTEKVLDLLTRLAYDSRAF